MIERELKNYWLGVSPICDVVDKHIYAGRIPKTAQPETAAILIRRLGTNRTYGLFGEDDCCEPILQVDLKCRLANADVLLHRLFENCRKSLNEFAAAPGKMGSIWVVRALIISETVDIPLAPVASGASWKWNRSFDVQIMHNQEVVLA